MLKSELVDRIAAQNPHNDLYRRDVEGLVNAIMGAIEEALRRRDRVEIRGFGTFTACPCRPQPRSGAIVGSPHDLFRGRADRYLKDRAYRNAG
jgi:integration host factor subunit beta